MKRKILSTLLLLLTGMMFVGCGRDQDGVSVVTAPTVVRLGSPSILNVDLDELEYEVFSGTLYPGQDGLLNATMTTWGKNCVFSLAVPASSMPPGSGPINFTMSIPTKQSYIDHLAELDSTLIIRLAPDGETFSGPITVSGTWMAWPGFNPEPPDTLWAYDPDGTDSTLVTITPVPSTPPRWRVSFQVYHFSDWETGPDRNE